MPRSYRVLFFLVLLAMVLPATTSVAADKPLDPCSLLAPAEIQAVTGKDVQPGKPKVQSNPLAGADCTYVVGGFGSLRHPTSATGHASSTAVTLTRLKEYSRVMPPDYHRPCPA